MNFESLVGHINQVQDVLQAQAAPSRPTSQTPTPTNRPVPGSADSDAAFFKCYSLKEVSFPESVTTMEGTIFAYCEKLESVILPQHITKISMVTFFGCKALRSVTIPAEVTYIDLAAFYECESLKEVTCLGTTPPTADSSAFVMLQTNQMTLYVPDESVDLYKATPVWTDFNVQPISAKQ